MNELKGSETKCCRRIFVDINNAAFKILENRNCSHWGTEQQSHAEF